MRTTQIRQQLHDYIDNAEDKKLKAIYTLLEDDLSGSYQLSKEQKEELDRRYNDYMNGVGETYTMEQTIAMAREALKNGENLSPKSK
jgi:hypothetical protein